MGGHPVSWRQWLPARVRTTGCTAALLLMIGKTMISASDSECATFTAPMSLSPCKPVWVCFGQKFLECVQALLIFRLLYSSHKFSHLNNDSQDPRFYIYIHKRGWMQWELLSRCPKVCDNPGPGNLKGLYSALFSGPTGQRRLCDYGKCSIPGPGDLNLFLKKSKNICL
jgi:hypothetical protein